ncbi:MAG: HK97 family phage prohead protease [Pseudomonadota bacterium]|nr:HK97 family phage prohead protease [Pseudomonadota bacterium]
MLLHTCPVLELRAHGEGIVEGIASTFGGIDSFGDTVLPGAYSKTISEHAAAGTAPAMLWSHRAERPVGKWQQLGETGRGLEVAGRLNLRTHAGREAFEHVQAQDLTGLSVGFTMHPIGSERRADGVRAIKAARLHEISLVALPSDEGARITGIKSLDLARPETARDFQAALQQIGFSRREAVQIATKGYAGFTPDAADDEPDDKPDNSTEFATALSAIRSLTQLFKG